MASKPKSRLSVFRHRRTSDASLQATENSNNNHHNGIHNNGRGSYGGNSVQHGRTHPGVNLDNKSDDFDDFNKFSDDEDIERRAAGNKQAVHHQRRQEGSFHKSKNGEGGEEELELDPLPERDERFWYSANDISLSQLSPIVTTNALSSSTQQRYQEKQQQQQQRSRHHRASSSSSSLSSTEAITREKRLAKALLHLHIQAAENVVASTNAKQRRQPTSQKNGQLLSSSSKREGNKESGHDDDNPSPALTMTKTTATSRRKISRNAIVSLVDSLTTVNPSPRSSYSMIHMNPNGHQDIAEDYEEADGGGCGGEDDDNWENESLSDRCGPLLEGPRTTHHHRHNLDDESTIEIKLSSNNSSSQDKSNDQSTKKAAAQQSSKAVGMKNKTSKPILLHYHHNKLEDTDHQVTNTSETAKDSEENKKRRARSLSIPEKIWNDLLSRSFKKQKRHSTSVVARNQQQVDLQSDQRSKVVNQPLQQQQQQALSKYQNRTYRLSAPTFPLPTTLAFSDRSMDSLVSMSSIVQTDVEPEIKPRDRNRWALFSFRRKSKRALALTNPRDHVVLANSVREKPEKFRRSSITGRRRSSVKENRKLSGIENDFGGGKNNGKQNDTLHVSDEVIPNGEYSGDRSGCGGGDTGSGDDGSCHPRPRPDCEIVSMDLDRGPGLSKKSSGGFLKSFRLKKNKVSNVTSSGGGGGDGDKGYSSGTAGAADGCCGVVSGSGENVKKAADGEINVNVRNKKGIGIGAGDKDGTDDNNKNKLRRFSRKKSKKKSKKNKGKSRGDMEDEEEDDGGGEGGRKTSANIFQAFYYAGRRHESVTAKDFDDVTLDLASGELKKTQDGTVIVENATGADVDIVPDPHKKILTKKRNLASGEVTNKTKKSNSGTVKEIARDVTNIHRHVDEDDDFDDDDDDDRHGQGLSLREILGNHRGGFRPMTTTAASASKTAASRVSSSNITNAGPSATRKQDSCSNSTPLYASPVKSKKKNKNQSEGDVSSIIPTSSTLVTQQLLTFDSSQNSQNRSSQTEAQILVHRRHEEEEDETGDEGGEDDEEEAREEEEDGEGFNSMSISPPKSLLGRVKDFHRNGVFGFGSSGSSPSSRSTKSSGSSGGGNKNKKLPKNGANHMAGHNGSSNSSNDFYGSPNNATACSRDNLTGQSYRAGEEEEEDEEEDDEMLCVQEVEEVEGDDAKKNEVRNSGKNDRGGGRSRNITVTRGLSRNDEALRNGGGISAGSESRRNSSEEELTSINNVSAVGRASTSLPTTASTTTAVTTSVAMALPPTKTFTTTATTRRSNPLSSGTGSLSDSSSASTPGASMEDYNGPFVGKAVALVDCTPSPYDRHAIRYKKGDVIQIISKKASGWWTGKVNNQVGHFKFINVQVLPDDEDDVFDMEYEGDYSRDEDYYYNNCTRNTGGGGYESDTHSNVSSIRRRNRHYHRKASLMTPWELEQRQAVASVINGIRKENKALRREGSSSAVASAAAAEGPKSDPPSWNEAELDGVGGSSNSEKFSDSSSTKLTGFPDVKRTNSSSQRGERSSKGSSKQKKEKKGRPKSVGDLLERIHLEEYISVFILHGFESLDLFKELEEEDLDRLAILNEADRAKILTAVEFLRDYDTEEEIPIPMIIPPAPPSLPPPSSSSSSGDASSDSRPHPPVFPRDSGIFVKCDEDGEAEFLETNPDVPSSSFKSSQRIQDVSTNESGSNLNDSHLNQKGGGSVDEIDDGRVMMRKETNQANGRDATLGGRDEELILSPLNLHKMHVGGPSFTSARLSVVADDDDDGNQNGHVKNGKPQADLFGDVKQRFLNAKSMFEMASTSTSGGSRENGGKSNRFSYDKSSDSGISCSANSPPLTRTDH